MSFALHFRAARSFRGDTMKTTVRFSLFFLILAAADYSMAQTRATLTSNVNLRSTPSTTSSRVATLKQQAKVTLLSPSETSGFYHVRTDQGQEGWVWAKSVNITQISRKLVRRPATSEGETTVERAAAAKCQPNLDACPVTGCAAP